VTDATKVVAFAIRQFDRDGTHTVRIGGDGTTSIAFAPAGAAQTPPLSVVYHFVAAPVAIGAATSPASILAPLEVTLR
jgi:hypothetical protein